MERRQFIAGSAIAALSVSALPIASATASGDRTAWEQAVRRYTDAEAEADRYTRDVWLPLSEKAEQTEAEAGLVGRTRYAFLERRKDHMKAHPKLYFDLGQAGTEADRLGEIAGDAFSDAMATPAPDLAALRWKLERLRDHKGALDCYSAEFIEQTFADIDRLLPQGR